MDDMIMDIGAQVDCISVVKITYCTMAIDNILARLLLVNDCIIAVS